MFPFVRIYICYLEIVQLLLKKEEKKSLLAQISTKKRKKCPAWLFNYEDYEIEKNSGRSSVSCVLLFEISALFCDFFTYTYRVVVRVLRNILTYRVCDPAFPLHLRAWKLSSLPLVYFGIVLFRCCTTAVQCYSVRAVGS